MAPRKKPRKTPPAGHAPDQAVSPPPPGKKTIYHPEKDPAPNRQLTLREDEVHFWVVRGKVNDEIARILEGNAETVRKHVENIREKFGAESRLALIAMYWQGEVDKRDRVIAELERRLKERP